MFLSHIVIFLLFTLTVSSEEPHQFNWFSKACTFNGNDLTNKTLSKLECIRQCKSMPNCSHFTWTGGTCFLKHGSISVEQAVNVTDRNTICGILRLATNTNGTETTKSHTTNSTEIVPSTTSVVKTTTEKLEIISSDSTKENSIDSSQPKNETKIETCSKYDSCEDDNEEQLASENDVEIILDSLYDTKNEKEVQHYIKYLQELIEAKDDLNASLSEKACKIDSKTRKAIDKSLSDCDSAKSDSSCSLTCRVGYTESKLTHQCRRITEKSNKTIKYEWDSSPTCTPQTCSIKSFLNTHKFLISSKINFKSRELNIDLFFVSYDAQVKLPQYTITIYDSLNTHKAHNHLDFRHFQHPCPELSNKQYFKKDYDNSLYEMGHLTPIESMLFSYKSTLSSNMFVNIAPQDPFTNQHPWKEIESETACFLGDKYGLVISGTCAKYSKKGKLMIPACFWKLVCFKNDNETIVAGFYADNSLITPSNLEKREKQVKTLRSLNYIQSKIGDIDLDAAWAESAYLFKSRVLSRLDANLIRKMPNIGECSVARELPKTLKGSWDSNKAKKGSNPIIFGCNNTKMSEYRSVFDENSFKNESFTSKSCNKRLIGYFTSWGTKRFTHRQARTLTHAIFAFFETLPDGEVRLGSADSNRSKDPQLDLRISKQRLLNFKRVSSAYPDLKTMFAVGGWENSQYFSAIAADERKRQNFIASIIKIIDEHDFDGVDIDWEHPVTGGAVEGVAEDKQNYVALLKELRNTLDRHRKAINRKEPFLISFAGAAGQWSLDPGYDLVNLLKYADWANVMSYDYFGAWDSKWGAYTGPPAPLYYSNPKGFSGKVNVHWSIRYYVCKTRQPHKINMGVPFYGRYWKNVGDPVDARDAMWRMAEEKNGKFEGGFAGWASIKDKWLKDPKVEIKMHRGAKVPFAWSEERKEFLGFESPESLAEKVRYAEEHNLGGFMIWAVDHDDEDSSMLNVLARADLCNITNPNKIVHKCLPIDEKRWWTSEDGYEKAGMCGKSAPLYNGYYAICDPDDPGYSCCGASGYCGSGSEYCDCPTCVNYAKNPEKILEEPIKPTTPVRWYFLNDEDGKRGRCGRGVPLLNGSVPICNPDDENAHCCSNGGYCGKGAAYCECSGCVDFKMRPKFEYKEKTWWEWTDGPERTGTCGPTAQRINGKIAECNPDSDFYCCSAYGSCGQGDAYCNCKNCVNYREKANTD